MVDGYFRMMSKGYVTKKTSKRVDPHPKRCQWVTDTLYLRVCPRLLKDGDPGPYCPKHRRIWKELTSEL